MTLIKSNTELKPNNIKSILLFGVTFISYSAILLLSIKFLNGYSFNKDIAFISSSLIALFACIPYIFIVSKIGGAAARRERMYQLLICSLGMVTFFGYMYYVANI